MLNTYLELPYLYCGCLHLLLIFFAFHVAKLFLVVLLLLLVARVALFMIFVSVAGKSARSFTQVDARSCAVSGVCVSVAIFRLSDGACSALPEPWLIVDHFDFFAVNQLLVSLARKFVFHVPPEMHINRTVTLAIFIVLVNSVDAFNESDAQLLECSENGALGLFSADCRKCTRDADTELGGRWSRILGAVITAVITAVIMVVITVVIANTRNVALSTTIPRTTLSVR